MVMARSLSVFTARDIPSLQTAVNAWFTANDSVLIRHFQFICRDVVGAQGLELSVWILSETGGSQMGNPFTATVYKANNPEALEAALDAVIDAAPDEFWQGPFVDYVTQQRRTDHYYGLLINTSDEANGQTNWTWS